MPDKFSHFLEVSVRFAWSPKGLRTFVWAAVTLVTLISGGFVFGWDRLAQLLSLAPIIAFLAVLAFSDLNVSVPTVTSRDLIVFDYRRAGPVFPEGAKHA